MPSSGGGVSVTTAHYLRLTIEPGNILLKVGPGDHTVQVFKITHEQLRGLVLDAMPELLV